MAGRGTPKRAWFGPGPAMKSNAGSPGKNVSLTSSASQPIESDSIRLAGPSPSYWMDFRSTHQRANGYSPPTDARLLTYVSELSGRLCLVVKRHNPRVHRCC